MRFHAISCNFLRFHAISCDFVRFRAISCDFKTGNNKNYEKRLTKNDLEVLRTSPGNLSSRLSVTRQKIISDVFLPDAAYFYLLTRGIR